ncbi:MAG TPA: GNAT family N-acetyltransferase [Pyrinomonadaceae bacterium]
MNLIQATTPKEIETARELFKEYEAWIGISLCFQNFDREVANLPGDYAPPRGRLFLASEIDSIVGCVALRAIVENTCEMKRLYVRPEFRGRGLGRSLIESVIAAGTEIGYSRMRLDTLPGRMDKAIALYEQLGFKDIPAYYNNPVKGARFMELAL